MRDSASGRVLVVGGGIAGFAMVRALRQRAVPAGLVERLGGPPDAGLGVNLPGNAVRALNALGVGDGLSRCGVPVRRREYRNAADRLLFAVDEAAFWGEGSPPRCVLRGELLDLLRAGVAAESIRWDTPVHALRPSGGVVEVSLGASASEGYDFVVGADGVRSTVRDSVVGRGGPTPALLSAASWRFLTTNPGVDCWTVWSGGAAAFLLIPVTADLVYGYGSATGGGAVGGDPGWLRSTFAGFPEPVRRAVATALAEPASLYHSPLEEIRLDRWHRDRVVLIGDAAHATAPVWAQGAALAAEDALVLAELLATRRDWTTVGREYERRRRPRIEHVQRMTDRMSRTAALPGWLRDAIAPYVGPRTYRQTFTPLRQPVVTT